MKKKTYFLKVRIDVKYEGTAPTCKAIKAGVDPALKKLVGPHTLAEVLDAEITAAIVRSVDAGGSASR